jgi:hypothetical protein
MLTSLNPLKKGIGIIVTVYDKSTNSMEIQDQHYTRSDTINIRYEVSIQISVISGFTLPINTAIYQIPLSKVLAPLFEALLDKSKFSPYNLPSDTPIGYGWVFQIYGMALLTAAQPAGIPNRAIIRPFVCTFNVGVLTS